MAKTNERAKARKSLKRRRIAHRTLGIAGSIGGAFLGSHLARKTNRLAGVGGQLASSLGMSMAGGAVASAGAGRALYSKKYRQKIRKQLGKK